MKMFEAIAAMLYISQISQMDSEEYSLGQEDRIVVVEDIANSESKDRKEEESD